MSRNAETPCGLGFLEQEKIQKPLCVMKFGGTSVGNARAIEQATNIVERDYKNGKQIIVVASAMSGVTNHLVSICNFVQNSEHESILRELRTIFDLHMTAITELKFSPESRANVQEELRDLFMQLRDDVGSVDNLTSEKKDHILSFGERLNVRILAARLREKGVNAIPLDATKVVVTNNNFGEAKPLFDETRTNTMTIINPLLQERIIPIITGFIGRTSAGQTTTLGRGGSDYTASILGWALEAEEVVIWTDVNGVYDSDPNKNPDATIIPEMSYESADKMAKNGAKVLYTKTVEPLFGTKTVIYVKNTFNPDFPGTKIVN